MKEKVEQEVSIVCYYKAKSKQFVPHMLHWQSKDYMLGTVDYYHSYMEGQERQHIFELCDKETTIWFRLRLDGGNLHWTLEAIHDGLAS